MKMTYAVRPRTVASAAVCAVAIGFCWAQAGPAARENRNSEERPSKEAVEFQMKNVNFEVSPGIVLEVHSLRGRLQRTHPETPVTFDDNASFTVETDSAEIAITSASLTALMNSYVLAFEGAPIKNVTVTMKGNQIVQKGTMHKGVDLPFEIEGTVSATEQGEIRMHADKIKAEHIPVKGLLHFLGDDLGDLVKKNAGRGVRFEGDDIILSPAAMTPPPHIEGRVSRVAIVGDKLIQVFDSGRHPAALKPPFRSAAYIYHRGGTLRFGKLTMNDADLEIVGNQPGVFNFFQREYKKQLVAGYSKNTSANGLVAHMVDYSRLPTSR